MVIGRGFIGVLIWKILYNETSILCYTLQCSCVHYIPREQECKDYTLSYDPLYIGHLWTREETEYTIRELFKRETIWHLNQVVGIKCG